MDTDQNRYFVTLDAVDLNYVSACLNRSNGKVMPLWTTSNLHRRNDEYFEFKIEYPDSQISANDELNPEVGNTLCHICEIDVPTPFLDEHYESFKHKINIKIINTALERIKKSIGTSTGTTTETSKYSNLRFCPVCVTVVNKEEKQSHEKSVLHKYSVIIEKFLYDFYLLYANETKLNDAEIVKDNNEKDYKESVDKIGPKTNGVPKNELEKIVEKNIINPDNPSAYKIIESKTNGNIKLTGSQEFNDVVKTMDKVETKVKIKKNKKAKIKKNDSEVTKITKGKKSTCKVNPTQGSDTSTVQTKKKNKKVKLYNDDIPSQVLPYVEDIVHSLERTSDVNIKSDVSVSSKDFEYEKYIHHLQETLYSLHCIVCKIDIKVKKRHLESESHYKNYLKFLVENMTVETTDNKVECTACGDILDRNQEIEHCIKITHITNLEIRNKMNGILK